MRVVFHFPEKKIPAFVIRPGYDRPGRPGRSVAIRSFCFVSFDYVSYFIDPPSGFFAGPAAAIAMIDTKQTITMIKVSIYLLAFYCRPRGSMVCDLTRFLLDIWCYSGRHLAVMSCRFQLVLSPHKSDRFLLLISNLV